MGLTSPFFFGAARAEHLAAFDQLRSRDGFAAEWGFRTAERRHRCYNFSTDCVTSWHAPVWPFESAKLGSALIHVLTGPLAHAAAARGLLPRDFADFLLQFARMHTRGRAAGVQAGSPFIGESFHPDDGYWLTRDMMFRRRHGDKRRGDHYFHSSFVDLVLGGIVGVRVEQPSAVVAPAGTLGIFDVPAASPAPTRLVVQPLFARGQLRWFRASRLRIRGHDVAVSWDETGEHFGGGAGLALWVDGEVAACTERLERLEAVLPR